MLFDPDITKGTAINKNKMCYYHLLWEFFFARKPCESFLSLTRNVGNHVMSSRVGGAVGGELRFTYSFLLGIS